MRVWRRQHLADSRVFAQMATEKATARRVLAELPMGLREATVEDVRTALENVTHTVGKATRQQYILRTNSLLGYAHKVGYTPF
jgi:hypothetical protein